MRADVLACESLGRSWSGVVTDARGDERAFDDGGGVPAVEGLVPGLHGLLEAHGPVKSLAVATGPGSFTGLRIACVAVRTLAWTDNLPIHGIDSLAALASAQGPGLWWTLLPLKKDTTFHALWRVGDDGLLDNVVPVAPVLNSAGPRLDPEMMSGAVAIGPALALREGLAESWHPGVTLGDPAPLDARGVAAAAAHSPAVSWREIVPIYHQKSAPELQREASVVAPERSSPEKESSL